MNIPIAHLYADALFAAASNISFQKTGDAVLLTVELKNLDKFIDCDVENSFETFKNALTLMGDFFREEKEQKKRHTMFYDTDPDKLSREEIGNLYDKIKDVSRDFEDALLELRKTLKEAQYENND